MPRSRKTTASRNRRRAPGQQGRILDLFAGAGGWEEALAMLGLRALGIETDPHVCATARAAGHERLQADVAEVDPLQFEPVWGLVGSPPCQAYSSAGKGLGRADKPLLIACAHELAAGNDSRPAWREGCRDPRSLLTVEPLRYILALRPQWVALEQVPAVLELWTMFAGLLAGHGYQTAAGILSAERYGVPQTRKRAFLIASLDGPVALPEPTHRSYNPRRSEIPEDELALQPWVSMAEALGWAPAERVGFPRRNDTPSNRPSPLDTGVYRSRDQRPASSPAPTLTQKTRSWTRRPCVQIRRSGERITEGFDPTCAPAQAVTTRVGCWQANGVQDGWAWRNGNQRNAAIRNPEEPAPTVHFGHSANQVEWVPCAYETRQRGARPRPINRPAPTMLAAGLAKGTPIWAGERPATTVACDRRVHPPGHKECAADPPGRYEQRRGANAVRVTVCQAAILQGFPADYPWQGARTRQFEQVGNAVPPPVAHRVLEQAIQSSVRKRQPTKPSRARQRSTGCSADRRGVRS
jgi:DNA (cytosine-5)-methyltransferase 1